MMDSNTAALATLGATQGIVLFTTLMPSRSVLRQSYPEPGIVADCRHGEMMAGVLTLGFSALLAWLVGSREPLVIGVITVAAMVGAYEFTLAQTGS